MWKCNWNKLITKYGKCFASCEMIQDRKYLQEFWTLQRSSFGYMSLSFLLFHHFFSKRYIQGHKNINFVFWRIAQNRKRRCTLLFKSIFEIVIEIVKIQNISSVPAFPIYSHISFFLPAFSLNLRTH